MKRCKVARVHPDLQKARIPVLPSCEDKTGPCEGRQASPSNPTHAPKRRVKNRREQTVVMRCTAAEKAELHAKAEASGLTVAALLRCAMEGAQVRRPRPVPVVAPSLDRALGRIGGNVNQIAKWLNTATRAGHISHIDAASLCARLVQIDRQLRALREEQREVADAD